MFWQETDLRGSDYGEKENETLHTDILRFLSIIGFCLMAIFALVQAIPVTGMKQGAAIEELDYNPNAQGRELAYLRVENKRLNSELNRLIGYEKIAQSREEELDWTKKEFNRQKALIDRLTEQKITEKEGLIEYKKLLSQREKEIGRLKEAKKQVALTMRKAVTKLSDFKGELMAEEPIQAKTVKQKSLYVAFKSDRVFLGLLRADKISLLINVSAMKPGFSVISNGNSFDFVSGAHKADRDLWEIKENMVPARILNAFKSWTTLSSREKILTVGLTPEISHQIRDKRVTRGRFIINEGGAVAHTFEP